MVDVRERQRGVEVGALPLRHKWNREESGCGGKCDDQTSAEGLKMG
jgi:hypothetical protein